jgi:hypothetical protein
MPGSRRWLLRFGRSARVTVPDERGCHLWHQPQPDAPEPESNALEIEGGLYSAAVARSLSGRCLLILNPRTIRTQYRLPGSSATCHGGSIRHGGVLIGHVVSRCFGTALQVDKPPTVVAGVCK